jgi:rod shape-determining protein MreD
MKWLPFAILAVAGIVCQTTIVPHMRVRWFGPEIGPDWMFILAVFYALWGPWPEAAIAAWILGVVTDLESAGMAGSRIGLHAFCYGAAAWGIIRTRQAVMRGHWLAQVFITLVFALGVEAAVRLYQHWSAPAMGLGDAGWGAMLSAAYTAAWAPILLWALMRLGRLAGLKVETQSWKRRRR